jgi:hypothetical protein
VAFYLGQQRARLKLRELARLSRGVGYTAVAKAVRRQIQRDKAWQRRIDAISRNCQK